MVGWMLFFGGWGGGCYFSVGGWMDVLFGGWMFYLVGGRMFFLWVGICDLFNQLVTDVIIQQQKRKTKILSNQQPIG